MGRTRKHQNLTSTTAHSVCRSSVNVAEQDLPVKQKSNASESFNSAMKCKNVVSKVVLLKKQARKHRSDSKLDGSEMAVDLPMRQKATRAKALNQP